ncbi:MAG: hypothetical protein J6D03_09595 [Clostridia bacterium]|nr:hypothetical protein [Clostridia bacterium]
MNENIKRYDKMLYDSGPISFTDFIADKPDKVHNQLYRDALQKYLVEHPELNIYKSAYHFIEIKNTEYWQPSYVNIISKRPPHRRNKVWLDSYWCKYQNKYGDNYTYTYIDNDSMIDARVISINYVAGEVEMQSKLTGVKFKIPFNKLDDTTPLSPDFLENDNTFSEQAKQYVNN